MSIKGSRPLVLGVAASPVLMVPAAKAGPDLGAVIKKAASRALP